MPDVPEFQERRNSAKVRRADEATSAAGKKKSTIEVIASGTIAEMVGGTGAVVLSIIGLAGAAPAALAAVSAITIGGAIMVEAILIGMEYQKLVPSVAGTRIQKIELAGGLTLELLGGAAGVLLGVFSLFTAYSATLLPVSAIVLGTRLFSSSATKERLNAFRIQRMEHNDVNGTMTLAIGAQVLGGLGAVILGVLALFRAPVTLTLVAMLTMGGMNMLSAVILGGRMLRMEESSTISISS